MRLVSDEQPQREQHPGRAVLGRIEDWLEEVGAARDALLPTLAALKLAVVAELVDVEDQPEAHRLIVGAREDMLSL